VPKFTSGLATDDCRSATDQGCMRNVPPVFSYRTIRRIYLFSEHFSCSHIKLHTHTCSSSSQISIKKRQNNISSFLPVKYFTLYTKQNKIVCCQDKLFVTSWVPVQSRRVLFFKKVKITGQWANLREKRRKIYRKV